MMCSQPAFCPCPTVQAARLRPAGSTRQVNEQPGSNDGQLLGQSSRQPGAGHRAAPGKTAHGSWQGSGQPGVRVSTGAEAGEVEGVGGGAAVVNVARHAHQRVGLAVEVVLEGNHDGLEALVGGRASLGADVVGDARHVGGIQRRVDLVQHEEGRWLVRVDRKKQRQRRHRLHDELFPPSQDLVRMH